MSAYRSSSQYAVVDWIRLLSGTAAGCRLRVWVFFVHWTPDILRSCLSFMRT